MDRNTNKHRRRKKSHSGSGEDSIDFSSVDSYTMLQNHEIHPKRCCPCLWCKPCSNKKDPNPLDLKETQHAEKTSDLSEQPERTSTCVLL